MKRLAAILFFAAIALQAQTPVPVADTPLSGKVKIKPQAVPTTLTMVAGSDADITSLVITNTTSGAITVYLQDGQASPVVGLLPAASIPALSAVVVTVPAGYWCPGGFSIQAGGAGLTFQAKWSQ